MLFRFDPVHFVSGLIFSVVVAIFIYSAQTQVSIQVRQQTSPLIKDFSIDGSKAEDVSYSGEYNLGDISPAWVEGLREVKGGLIYHVKIEPSDLNGRPGIIGQLKYTLQKEACDVMEMNDLKKIKIYITSGKKKMKGLFVNGIICSLIEHES